MKLAIFNGSPRGTKSNTKLLLEHFQNGFTENGGEVVTSDFLIQEKHLQEQVLHFKQAENILIAFPLYTDSFPGIVKKFIEEIGNFDGSGKRIMFLVQSGFPEGIQSDGVKNYLKLLTKRWKMDLMGIIIKPGAEGIQIMPDAMTKKIFQRMTSFGAQIAMNQIMDKAELIKFASPYKFSKFRMLLFRFLNSIGLTNLYWNHNLKKHHAYKKRFDAPYLK